jgi:hypothetical protein
VKALRERIKAKVQGTQTRPTKQLSACCKGSAWGAQLTVSNSTHREPAVQGSHYADSQNCQSLAETPHTNSVTLSRVETP